MAPPTQLGIGLSLARGIVRGGLDPDAKAYIAAVEAADGQSLEIGVRSAYSNFIKGCKDDGIWDAIKASCILAGARTLSGALVPLKGTAPTNNNFVSADYNRKTGLKGNLTTKFLDSNRNNNADPQDSKHLAAWKTANPIAPGGTVGTSVSANGASWIYNHTVPSSTAIRVNQSASTLFLPNPGIGLFAASRSSATTINTRINGVTVSHSAASDVPLNDNLTVFRGAGLQYTDARLAFYSIGEALDLAALDSRVSTLISDIAAAIP